MRYFQVVKGKIGLRLDSKLDPEGQLERKSPERNDVWERKWKSRNFMYPKNIGEFLYFADQRTSKIISCDSVLEFLSAPIVGMIKKKAFGEALEETE